ncbi:MAG: phosphatidylserine/phosphatidylglycerophosphate/cardiolipin synthase family protein [Sphaerochaetaceae bacterium]
MKKLRVFIFILASMVLFLTGCSTTGEMVDGIGINNDLSISEKMEDYGIPSVKISKPDVYYDGSFWVDRLCEEFEKADDYIVCLMFLGSECDENQKIFDILKEKSESGVDVFFITDGTGAFDMTESRYHLRPVDSLKESGVHVFVYNPFSVNRLSSGIGLFQREHRKFFVVDGKTLFIGGMNINYISTSSPSVGGQRDAMYCFHSSDVASLIMDDFVDYWNHECIDEVERSSFEIPNRSSCETLNAWFVDQYGTNLNIAKAYSVLINSAEKEVLSLPFLPYFDKNMLEMVSNAINRDVYYEMIIPFDSRISQRNSTYYALLRIVETGANVLIENSSDEMVPLLHEKLLVVDSRYTLFGSSNFNYRSMNLSNEMIVIVDDIEFAQQVKDHYQELKQTTHLLDLETANNYQKLKYLPGFIFCFFGG